MWCFKGGTLLPKVTTKLRVKPHVRSIGIGSKGMRWIKVLIVGVSLLEWSRMLLSLSSEPVGEGVLFG
jgi:hypothetical protein